MILIIMQFTLLLQLEIEFVFSNEIKSQIVVSKNIPFVNTCVVLCSNFLPDIVNNIYDNQI